MRNLLEITPREKRAEIVSAYLTGENTYEELGKYYKVSPAKIRTWVSRHRKAKKVVSLPPESQSGESMARNQKASGKSPEVLLLESRIRELELQNLALTTLIDVAERNGLEIRKKSGAKQ